MGAGAEKYVKRALELGCYAIAATLDEDDLTLIEDLEAVVYSGPNSARVRQALSKRAGPIVPILMDENFEVWLMREQSICIDTTAAGGNAALLAG
jgi:RHH-type proline utilization regulon transcriptional repressor/proline dehydrogenase/delta 1-pyrroline-5-carboxylate dehydrogenase